MINKEDILNLDYYSYEITASNHNPDNSILLIKGIEEYCKKNNLLILGHQEAPFRNGKYHVAMVVYDIKNDSTFWVHTSLWNYCNLVNELGIYSEERKNNYIKKFGEEEF